jgi:hypothetical protein
MKRHGWTQSELGLAIGVSQSYVSRWLNCHFQEDSVPNKRFKSALSSNNFSERRWAKLSVNPEMELRNVSTGATESESDSGDESELDISPHFPHISVLSELSSCYREAHLVGMATEEASCPNDVAVSTTRSAEEATICLICTESVALGDIYPLPCDCKIHVCKDCVELDAQSICTCGSRCPQCRKETGHAMAVDYESDGEYDSYDSDMDYDEAMEAMADFEAIAIARREARPAREAGIFGQARATEAS